MVMGSSLLTIPIALLLIFVLSICYLELVVIWILTKLDNRAKSVPKGNYYVVNVDNYLCYDFFHITIRLLSAILYFEFILGSIFSFFPRSYLEDGGTGV